MSYLSIEEVEAVNTDSFTYKRPEKKTVGYERNQQDKKAKEFLKADLNFRRTNFKGSK